MSPSHTNVESNTQSLGQLFWWEWVQIVSTGHLDRVGLVGVGTNCVNWSFGQSQFGGCGYKLCQLVIWTELVWWVWVQIVSTGHLDRVGLVGVGTNCVNWSLGQSWFGGSGYKLCQLVTWTELVWWVWVQIVSTGHLDRVGLVGVGTNCVNWSLGQSRFGGCGYKLCQLVIWTELVWWEWVQIVSTGHLDRVGLVGVGTNCVNWSLGQSWFGGSGYKLCQLVIWTELVWWEWVQIVSTGHLDRVGLVGVGTNCVNWSLGQSWFGGSGYKLCQLVIWTELVWWVWVQIVSTGHLDRVGLVGVDTNCVNWSLGQSWFGGCGYKLCQLVIWTESVWWEWVQIVSTGHLDRVGLVGVDTNCVNWSFGQSWFGGCGYKLCQLVTWTESVWWVWVQIVSTGHLDRVGLVGVGTNCVNWSLGQSWFGGSGYKLCQLVTWTELVWWVWVQIVSTGHLDRVGLVGVGTNCVNWSLGQSRFGGCGYKLCQLVIWTELVWWEWVQIVSTGHLDRVGLVGVGTNCVNWSLGQSWFGGSRYKLCQLVIWTELVWWEWVQIVSTGHLDRVGLVGVGTNCVNWSLGQSWFGGSGYKLCQLVIWTELVWWVWVQIVSTGHLDRVGLVGVDTNCVNWSLGQSWFGGCGYKLCQLVIWTESVWWEWVQIVSTGHLDRVGLVGVDTNCVNWSFGQSWFGGCGYKLCQLVTWTESVWWVWVQIVSTGHLDRVGLVGVGTNCVNWSLGQSWFGGSGYKLCQLVTWTESVWWVWIQIVSTGHLDRVGLVGVGTNCVNWSLGQSWFGGSGYKLCQLVTWTELVWWEWVQTVSTGHLDRVGLVGVDTNCVNWSFGQSWFGGCGYKLCQLVTWTELVWWVWVQIVSTGHLDRVGLVGVGTNCVNWSLGQSRFGGCGYKLCQLVTWTELVWWEWVQIVSTGHLDRVGLVGVGTNCVNWSFGQSRFGGCGYKLCQLVIWTELVWWEWVQIVSTGHLDRVGLVGVGTNCVNWSFGQSRFGGCGYKLCQLVIWTELVWWVWVQIVSTGHLDRVGLVGVGTNCVNWSLGQSRFGGCGYKLCQLVTWTELVWWEWVQIVSTGHLDRVGLVGVGTNCVNWSFGQSRFGGCGYKLCQLVIWTELVWWVWVQIVSTGHLDRVGLVGVGTNCVNWSLGQSRFGGSGYKLCQLVIWTESV